jgi:hypothetical protein
MWGLLCLVRRETATHRLSIGYHVEGIDEVELENWGIGGLPGMT